MAPSAPLPSDLVQAHRDELLRWSRAWGLPGLEGRVRIEVSGRLTRSLGRCEPAKGGIRIARWLCEEAPALLPEVLCHELAHVAAFELHARQAAAQEGRSAATLLAGVWRRLGGEGRRSGPGRGAGASSAVRLRPHGREWRSLMRRAGFRPRVRIPESELPAAARARTTVGSRWDHSCPECGAHRIARRRMPQWRCRACREAGLAGELVVVKLPVTSPCVPVPALAVPSRP